MGMKPVDNPVRYAGTWRVRDEGKTNRSPDKHVLHELGSHIQRTSRDLDEEHESEVHGLEQAVNHARFEKIQQDARAVVFRPADAWEHLFEVMAGVAVKLPKQAVHGLK